VFKSIDGRPIDVTPRSATITVIQDINNYPITNQIAGVDIYYKPSSSTYWTKQPIDFVAYTEGQPYTFTFPQVLGARESNDKFDWVFRFRYTNGKQSTKQFRVMGTDVELFNGSRNFNIFTTVSPIAQGQEDVTAYNLLTTDDAPPGGGVVDPRDFQFSVTRSKNLAVGASSIGFHIDPPVDPDNIWAGARLYYKAAGASKWSNTSLGPIPLNGGFHFISQQIVYNAEFEYMLVPVVFFNGLKVDAFKGWYGKGSINFVAGTTFPDYWQKLNFVLATVSSIIQDSTGGGGGGGGGAAKTQAQVVDWTRQQSDGTGNSSRTLYFQLKYNAQNITNFTRVEIYRRERNIQAQNPYNNYYGIGRWEKIVVGAGNSTTVNSVTTVNLRLPLGHNEFNYWFGAPPGATSTNTALVVNSLFNTNKPLADFRATNFEYIIATVTSDGTFLQLLPHIPYIAVSRVVPGFNYGLPTNVTLSAYNQYPVGFLRNLDQAINSITNLSLLRYNLQTVTALATVPAGEPAVI
jgi:hypothetical protein